MTITGLTSKEEYVSKIVFPGIDGFPVQSVVLKNEPNKTLDESIRVVTRKGSSSGEILQEMTLSIACDEENRLILGDAFGALQLVSYSSDDTSRIPSYAKITWIYSTKNTGTTASVLKNMASGVNGIVTTVSPNVNLFPEGEYYIVAHETISLVNSATFSGDLTILEDSDVNECWSTSNYTFTI